MENSNIIFYTIHCPKCSVLESKLINKKIKYTTIDDEQELIKRGFENKEFPLLEVNGEILNFKEGINYINNYEN